MITRITRGTLRPDSEGRVFDILRAAMESSGSSVPTPGLISLSLSRRVTDEVVELVAVTIWRDLESMAALLGPNWQDPIWPPGLAECVLKSSVEVLETVVSSAEDLTSLGGT